MSDTIRTMRIAALASAALAVFSAQPALAADAATTDLNVNATVTTNCVVSTSAINFGDVDVTTGLAVDGSGGLSVKCTSGTSWTAGADAGSGAGADLATRKMNSGPNQLNYALYTDDGYTNLWGNSLNEGSSTFSGIGTGIAQDSTIYARVAAGQNDVPAGIYADTVTVSVNY